MKQKIKLIIFDFDGTLGDTRRNIITTLQQTMKSQGLSVVGEAACAATIGLTLEDSFRKFYPHLTEEQIAQCAAVYREIFEQNKKLMVPQLFPHVEETLRHLHSQGTAMAVASSRNSSSLNGFLFDMQIEKYFSYVIGADNVAEHKPSPEAVNKILKALNVEAGHTMVVGDMPVDILMGQGAGTMTCGVTYGNGSRKQLAESGADYVIDSMAELTSCLI